METLTSLFVKKRYVFGEDVTVDQDKTWEDIQGAISEKAKDGWEVVSVIASYREQGASEIVLAGYMITFRYLR